MKAKRWADCRELATLADAGSLLISLGHALGHPLTSFGLAGSGPLPEVLV